MTLDEKVAFLSQTPGGRLVQTWPKSLDQLPEMLDYVIRKIRTSTVLNPNFCVN